MTTRIIQSLASLLLLFVVVVPDVFWLTFSISKEIKESMAAHSLALKEK